MTFNKEGLQNDYLLALRKKMVSAFLLQTCNAHISIIYDCHATIMHVTLFLEVVMSFLCHTFFGTIHNKRVRS